MGYGYLVHEVGLGDGECSDPGKDDQGDSVEPGSDIGQAPQRQPELEGVQHVVDEKETAELRHADVELGGQIGGYGLKVLSGDSHREV